VRVALPADQVLGPIAVAAHAEPPGRIVEYGRSCFVLWDELVYRRSRRGDRLCILAAGELRRTVLMELRATPLGGHFSRDKTLALASRCVCLPGLPAAVDEFIKTCAICQRVKADHQAPAGLLFPLPVPTRRGGCISLDLLELPAARSGHDFLKVHIDLLTDRVWLVPTFKTATSKTAARNFVASVFRDVGLPEVLVSDRDMRFTSAFWTGLHAALGASLIFGSPHHNMTTGRTSYSWSSSPSTTQRRHLAPGTHPSCVPASLINFWQLSSRIFNQFLAAIKLIRRKSDPQPI
jgi:hypothetical protein